jgi:hypothetical protein
MMLVVDVGIESRRPVILNMRSLTITLTLTLTIHTVAVECG